MPYPTGNSSPIYGPEAPEKPSPILVGFIALVSILILGVIGLLIKQAFFTKPIPRSAAEAEYYTWKDITSKKGGVTPRNLRELARAEFDMKMYNEAINHMKEAIKLAPKAYALHSFLAKMYWVMGDADKAITEYKAELKLHESYPAYYDLGLIYTEKKDYDEAVKCFQEVLRIGPTDVDAMMALAGVYEKTKQYDLAIQQYSTALNYIPNYPPAVQGIQRIVRLKGTKQ